METGLRYRSATLLILLAASSWTIVGSLAAADETDLVVLINRGIGLYDLGMYNKSVAAYEQAIKLSPNDSDAWVGMGNVLSAMGRYNESIEAYDKAIGAGKRNADAWYRKGNAFVRLGRNKEALDCYDEALVLRPGYAEAYENRELARSARLMAPIAGLPWARLKIDTSPPGADVWMDGEPMGNNSFEKWFDHPERHTFELKKNGISRKINVTIFKPTDILVNLTTNETSINYPYD
jgi:tetratricopeptide (TPR) repeat protein